MGNWTVRRIIDAPLELVFATVADIRSFSRAIPHIIRVEILSEVQSGVGTRFRETRLMGGKEATTELEVTEYVENEHIRLVADSHGAIWDSVFRVRTVEGKTELELTMQGKAYKLLPKMMNLIIKGILQKALEVDMDCVKQHCEKHA